MPIPTEPIGSIPRPPELIAAMGEFAAGRISRDELQLLYDRALRDTIQRFEATGSPVITDGEQTKPSFATYPIHGLETLGPGGVTIPFADGHTRQLPRLTAGPFRYRTYAAQFLDEARKHTRRPVKQAVISASALSLLYPQEDLPGYARDTFLDDLVREAEQDIRRCLAQGASTVQIDFTEARLSVKLDHRIFVGVIDPIDPGIDSPEQVRHRVLEAAEVIPLAQLGTTDDCGFAPFGDDTSTPRDTAFEKIRARVAGTKLAAKVLGV